MAENFNFNTSFEDINTGLFGQDSNTSGSKTGLQTTDETITSQLEVDEAGILSFINDILSGNQGLASIFSEEGGAGLYGSSGAKQGTEDLLSKIAGEIAKVTGKTTETKTGTVETDEETTGGTTGSGIVDQFSGAGDALEQFSTNQITGGVSF